MGRPSKLIYQRANSIWYARILPNRWSTETTNMSEALRRAQFMRLKNRPWSEIKTDYGAKLTITIDTEGNTHAKMTQYYTDTQKGFDEFKSVPIEPTNNKNIANNTIDKTCKDISKLLDYEYELIKATKPPKKTLDYYRNRFDPLKRYVKKYNLNLDTFTSSMAIKYPQHRLHETVGHPGELGFNNRPAKEPTINKEIGFFRKTLWGIWKDEGRIQENPWTRVELMHKEKGDVAEIEPDPYTVEEVACILKNVDNALIRHVLIFQAMIGSRPGEEVLKASKEAIEKKHLWSSKKKQWDTFTYSPQAKKYFLENLDGKMEGLNSGKIHKAFVKACKKANLRIGKPYNLRSTFGTEALDENKIEVVQKLLRHKDPNTTRIFYAKTRSAEVSSAAEKLQENILQKIDI